MKVEFVKSAAEADQFPRHPLPEIALAGRSNVGKSSLLNCLAGRRGVARVSGRPGCTRLLNFFSVDAALCLVDLPGYGYAKVSRAERTRWAEVVDEYLEERDNLSGLIVIMDAALPPTDLDLEMLRFASTLGIPVLPVATKADKLAKNRKRAVLDSFAAAIGDGSERVVAFSARTGEGRPDVAKWIASACGLGRLA
ncbi:MAG: YihA family ribosome biogenesis GTP-binding protein [Deltaproteobacteria bacterium]|nr:YihA family ribosome biogenesis GTP-binding protein [Deltaproteobacteria bacterium]